MGTNQLGTGVRGPGHGQQQLARPRLPACCFPTGYSVRSSVRGHRRGIRASTRVHSRGSHAHPIDQLPLLPRGAGLRATTSYFYQARHVLPHDPRARPDWDTGSSIHADGDPTVNEQPSQLAGKVRVFANITTSSSSGLSHVRVRITVVLVSAHLVRAQHCVALKHFSHPGLAWQCRFSKSLKSQYFNALTINASIPKNHSFC